MTHRLFTIAALLALTLGAAPASADQRGTLVIETVKADGHRTAADCELRARDGSPVVARIRAGTGTGQTATAVGRYRVSCASRLGGLAGSAVVEVRAGKTSRHRVKLSRVRRPGVLRGDGPRVATPPPGQLRGTIRDARGRPVTGEVTITLTVTATDGRFAVDGLPPGRYDVRLVGRTGPRTRATARVESGKTAEVDLGAAATKRKGRLRR